MKSIEITINATITIKANDDITLQLRRGEDIRLGLLGEDGHLLLVEPLDGSNLVPKPGRPFKLQSLGSLVHLRR